MIKRNISSAVVTGPTGCIGTALCKKLIEKGIETFAVVRPNCKRLSGLPKEVKIIQCDISDLKSLTKQIKSCDAFFHLAWANTAGLGRNDMYSQTDNIRYGIDAVNVAKELNCKVFVGAGSQAEYGRVDGILKSDTPCNPENGYGMAKLCAGEMTRVECGKYNIAHIWMRVASIYGPNDGPNSLISYAIKELLNNNAPNLTKCDQLWDYLYSFDAAEAFICAAMSGKDGSVYPLGSGKVSKLREYIEILRNSIDSNLPINFGAVEYPVNQVMHLQADISPLSEDTGFSPKWSFEDGIGETIKWIKTNV